MMPKLFILGIGNEMRGDDAAGIVVANGLSRRFKGAAVVETHVHMLWSLLQSGLPQTHLALIDAAESYAGFAVGTWRRFDYPAQVESIESATLRNTHSIDLVSMLQLGQALSTLPPHVRIYAIAGADFAMNPGISPPLEKHIADIEAAIGNDLMGWMEAESCTSSLLPGPFATSR